MKADERRKAIANLLTTEQKAVSGAALSAASGAPENAGSGTFISFISASAFISVCGVPSSFHTPPHGRRVFIPVLCFSRCVDLPFDGLLI